MGLIDLYAVPIERSQLNEVHELKLFIENKIREVRSNTIGNSAGQPSIADEILKYSLLMEKDIISKEEFDSLKKKLLG